MNDLSLLLLLGLAPEQYTLSDDHSFRGPCIQCGGTRRMVGFFNGAFPRWYLTCDLCGMRGWLSDFFNLSNLGELPEDSPLSAGEIIDRLNEATARAAAFAGSGEWETYHHALTEENRIWWRSQGIPDDWQDFWGLGYTPSHTFKYKDEMYKRPAYTIPKFDRNFVPVNMDYRLVDPPLGVGKYRPKYGLPSRVFIARPDMPNLTHDGRIVVVEGSKKAMVVSSQLGVQTLGIPGCSSWGDLLSLLQDVRYNQLVVVLDPDASKKALLLAKAIGKFTVQLSLPAKPDDAFLYYNLTPERFWNLVKLNGRKPLTEYEI